MSTLQTKIVRLGDSVTLANNFELVVPPVPDGTLTLQRQSGTDILTVNAAGQIQSPVGFESGSYTPVITGAASAGVGTYTGQSGFWQKFGKICFFNTRVTWTAHTGTGGLRISLPFQVAASRYTPVATLIIDVALFASHTAIFLTEPGTTFGQLYQMPVGGGTTSFVPIDPTGDIILQGTFFTA